MIFVEFHVFHANGAFFAPEWKKLAKRKAWGGFWRSLYREVAHFDEISGFSLHFMKYAKIAIVHKKGVTFRVVVPKRSPKPSRNRYSYKA